MKKKDVFVVAAVILVVGLLVFFSSKFSGRITEIQTEVGKKPDAADVVMKTALADGTANIVANSVKAKDMTAETVSTKKLTADEGVLKRTTTGTLVATVDIDLQPGASFKTPSHSKGFMPEPPDTVTQEAVKVATGSATETMKALKLLKDEFAKEREKEEARRAKEKADEANRLKAAEDAAKAKAEADAAKEVEAAKLKKPSVGKALGDLGEAIGDIKKRKDDAKKQGDDADKELGGVEKGLEKILNILRPRPEKKMPEAKEVRMAPKAKAATGKAWPLGENIPDALIPIAERRIWKTESDRDMVLTAATGKVQEFHGSPTRIRWPSRPNPWSPMVHL